MISFKRLDGWAFVFVWACCFITFLCLKPGFGVLHLLLHYKGKRRSTLWIYRYIYMLFVYDKSIAWKTESYQIFTRNGFHPRPLLQTLKTSYSVRLHIYYIACVLFVWILGPLIMDSGAFQRYVVSVFLYLRFVRPPSYIFVLSLSNSAVGVS